MNVTAHMPIEDFDTASNTSDLPQEWEEALIYGLARRLMTRYPPANPATRNEIKELASSTLSQALNFDAEDGSVFFQPHHEGGR